MDRNYLVVKSNYFIMNSNYDLSLEEQKVILTLASMVNPEDEEFRPYEFKISEFMELLGVDTKTKYVEIPKITKELMKKVFEIREEDKIIQVAWLSSVSYKKGTGTVELEFSPRLKPYMLQLKDLFTQYRLGNILNMKSKYSPRLYEMMKANEFKKQKNFEIEIDRLRELFNATDIYPLYADFKRHVLLKTQKELKKYTDISFEFQEIKTGRKVTSLKFYIKANEPTYNKPVRVLSSKKNKSSDKDKTFNDPKMESLRAVMDPIITNLEVKKIYDAGDGDIEKILKVYLYSKDKQVDNLVGYIIGILKRGYSEPKKNVTKTKKKDFDEREYDFEALEKKLLGWN